MVDWSCIGCVIVVYDFLVIFISKLQSKKYILVEESNYVALIT